MKKTTRATIETFTDQGTEDSLIRAVIAFINHTNELSCEKLNDIETALTEAINNVFAFAYSDKQGKISISIFIYDNKTLKIKIRDFGRGIKNVDEAREPLYSTESDRSGMGFSIMESFSDKLSVKSIYGKGTMITMLFKM